MKIEIKDMWSGKIIVCNEYSSLKEAVEKNSADLRGAYLGGADLRGAYLRGADLRGADLRGADLGGADLEGAYLRGAYLRGAYLEGAYLRGADLRGADLEGADLRGAYLRGADLEGAYLRGADLEGAKNYVNSHPFFTELIRCKEIKTFTDPEWAMIGQILVHTLCWDSIKKRYGKKIQRVFDVLAKDGFGEFKEKYKVLDDEQKQIDNLRKSLTR